MSLPPPPTPLPLPLSWPRYKVNVVPAGTQLPSHFRAEERIATPPLLAAGSSTHFMATVELREGHWTEVEPQCEDTPRGSFGKSKGDWHRAQHTGASRKSMCLEKKKTGFPKVEASGDTVTRSPSSELAVVFWIQTTLLPVILDSYLPLSKKKKKKVYVCVCSGVCMQKPQDSCCHPGIR